jgi:hypothetical protein
MNAPSIQVLLATALIGALSLITSSGVQAADKPNIVLILTDNLGYGEIGSYGGGITRGAATPRIDSLAKECGFHASRPLIPAHAGPAFHAMPGRG